MPNVTHKGQKREFKSTNQEKEYPQTQIEWVCPYSDCEYIEKEYTVYGFKKESNKYIFSLDPIHALVFSVHTYSGDCGSGWCSVKYVAVSSPYSTEEDENGFVSFSSPVTFKEVSKGEHFRKFYLRDYRILCAYNESRDSG